MFRRKRLPRSMAESYAAFLLVVGLLERAKAAATEAVPTGRLPGRPLADVLGEFEVLVREAEAGMDAWRDGAVEPEWRAARAGLRESLRLARDLRLEAPGPAGFEGLIGAIGDLIAPLEAFEAAEERFRILRR